MRILRWPWKKQANWLPPVVLFDFTTGEVAPISLDEAKRLVAAQQKLTVASVEQGRARMAEEDQ